MRSFLLALLTVGATLVVIWLLAVSHGRIPAFGVLLDPADGLWRTARAAEHAPSATVEASVFQATVHVVRDQRRVPHIFAENDLDAVRALGYVTAQDRLFQLDFIPRAAAGELSEALGVDLVETDWLLRRTGMDWGAKQNLARIEQQGGAEWAVLTAFSEGVNAYLDALEPADYPFEMRLLGYAPKRHTPLQTLRLIQYMNYDLSYSTYDASLARATRALGPEAAADVYPEYSAYNVPIMPQTGGLQRADAPVRGSLAQPDSTAIGAAWEHVQAMLDMQGTWVEGFRDGKGSNNWVISGARSVTGAPLLAGDPHLNLSLPAIWYEIHMVTPTMNTYGVTLPGAPAPVIGFNDYVGWTFTNTGSDQIDFYALELDESGNRYRFNGAWRDLEAQVDTVRIAGGEVAIDTLWYAHQGPVTRNDKGAFATRWTAHESNRIIQAIWGFNHARSLSDFRQAQRLFDAPMQNAAYADIYGNIALTSTGYLPHRRGERGDGVLDGTTDASAWIGPVPFDELPSALNPEQGYLASANQQPADPSYPYYQGRNYPAVPTRAIRINQLLRAKEKHSVEDVKAYQADVYVVQRDFIGPFLDSLSHLSTRATELRVLLQAWDGYADLDSRATLVFEELRRILIDLTWDELDGHDVPAPKNATLYGLLRTDPASPWFDRQDTPETEQAADLVRQALEQAVDSLDTKYGWGEARWRWGDHHSVMVRHLTQDRALRPLWRGAYPFPGFEETLMPGGGKTTTHSGSWRMVVDFSTQPPTGYGMYPGGQSGNPFSRHYDDFMEAYLAMDLAKLLKPAAPADVPEADLTSTLTLRPGRK